ncbi:hypothetical protein IJ531_01645 [bacterium]|nr:hypothetical protein [bacterium]
MISNVSEYNNNLNSALTPKTAPKTGLGQLEDKNMYYAKEGEPIYQKDMDLDEDGIVTFDELRKYCQENNADVRQLVKNWLVYHSTKEAQKASDEINGIEEEQEADCDLIYAKKGDDKYEAVMDKNDDNKITYKEYYEYCMKHSNDKKEGDKPEIKAVEEYKKQDSEPPEGKIETQA